MAEAKFGNGAVTYHGAVEAIPASETTEGNVTIRNAEQPGTPAFFEVSHMISASSEQNGLVARNTFHWTTLLPADSSELPYNQVEDEAAHQIAGALRELADAIEEEVARTDAERAKRADDN